MASAIRPVIVRLQGGGPPPGSVSSCAILREGTFSGASGGVRAAACWGRTVRWGNVTKESPEDDSPRQVILARDRRTGQVRAIQVGTACLRPIVYRPSEPERNDVDGNSRNLAEKFGSKRQKRHHEQSKKSKIDVDTLKAQLETTALKMDISQPSIVVNEEANSLQRYAPPADRDATDPRHVYSLDTIISTEEKLALESVAQSVIDGDTSYIKSEYIQKLILNVKNSNSASPLHDCIALLYADCLLDYLSCDYKRFRSPYLIVCSFSQQVNDAILDKFSIRSDKGRTRPQTMKDKGICYLIVLLLLSSNLVIKEYDELIKHLHVTSTKLLQLVKVVGARISTSNGENSIILKLPLVKGPTVHVKRDRK
ncbi:RNA polymerase I subunit E [Arctopsyche grandis]|uniref:RNA polymerase I subunit E n=1 Tax=Arctopsyche grandis TaxID=121162 RepID=UPI00406D9FFD